MKAPSSSMRMMLLAIGLVFVALAAGPAWNRAKVAYHIQSAKYALTNADIAGALDWLEYPTLVDPHRGDLQYLLACAYRRQGKLDRVAEHLDQARRYDWSREEIERQRLLTRVQAGDAKLASKFLADLNRNDVPDDVAEEVFEALAKCYLIEYRIADALVCLAHWSEWRPEALQPRLWRSQILERDNHWDLAADEYNAILKLQPDNVVIRIKLADSLMYRNQVNDALEVYQECLAESPKEPMALLGYAQCLRRMGNLEDARRALDQLADLDLEDDVRGHVTAETAQFSLEQRDYKQALKLFEEAVELAPDDSAAHYGLGMALSRLGKTERAQREFDLTKRIKAKNERISDIAQALLATPNNADLRYEAGKALVEEGFKQEGLRWWMQALDIDPRHRDTHRALAQFYKDEGNMAAYQQHLALSQAPAKSKPADQER